jgi:digeranylgeranylglycerophospholipid reductase
MARRNAMKYFDHFIAHLHHQGKIRAHASNPLLRGITLKPPRQTFGERLLVVGDAAGQVKPITGGGIYFGLLCADIAADCLRTALNLNDLSPDRLSGYQQQWHNLLGQELKIAHGARKIFERMNDAFIERLCNMSKGRRVLQALAQNQSIGFDWHGQAIKRAARRFLLNY